MDFQSLKQKVMKGFNHAQLVESLKVAGYAEPIDEAWTKAQMKERLDVLPGRPDLDENGKVVWLAEPTAEELAALEAEEAAKKAEEDRLAAEENAGADKKVSNVQPPAPANAPAVEGRHQFLLNVRRNGVSYVKGQSYNLSPEEQVEFKKLNAIA
jgi:hypothetical protein